MGELKTKNKSRKELQCGTGLELASSTAQRKDNNIQSQAIHCYICILIGLVFIALSLVIMTPLIAWNMVLGMVLDNLL